MPEAEPEQEPVAEAEPEQAGFRNNCEECEEPGTHGMSPQPDGTFEYYYCDEHYQVLTECDACGIELHPEWDVRTWPSGTYCRPCGRDCDPAAEPEQEPKPEEPAAAEPQAEPRHVHAANLILQSEQWQYASEWEGQNTVPKFLLISGV
eukprot:SAG11_NODE_719_length_7564_cov_14.939317_2_plen_149_part_00